MNRTIPAAHTRGLTLIEVLIALAVLAVAFTALAQSQILNLRQAVNTGTQSETKATAVRAMETLQQATLQSQEITLSTGVKVRAYAYTWYWLNCRASALTPGSTTYLPTNASTLSCTPNLGAGVTGKIEAQSGVMGEGLLKISVTAVNQSNTTVKTTLADVLTCYDVYPVPTSDTPAPCPSPTKTGGTL